jgi:predicted GTPase
VKWGEHLYQFIDTAGLNEGSAGAVKSIQAFNNLIDLIVRNRSGFNLLIMVIKAGRITKAVEINYELFVSKLVDEQVPVIVVVANCENEKNLQEWPKNNRKAITEDYKMTLFKDIIGSVWTIGNSTTAESFYGPMRNASKKSVKTAIVTYSLLESHTIAPYGLELLLTKIYNFFASVFG